MAFNFPMKGLGGPPGGPVIGKPKPGGKKKGKRKPKNIGKFARALAPKDLNSGLDNF